MLLNEAFQRAAGIIKPDPSPQTDKQLAREAKAKKVEMSFDASVDHLSPRDAARVAARSTASKNATLTGQRLPFKERARYLQEIIEDGRRRMARNNSALRVQERQT